jgi:hypothetical protein
MKQEAIKLNLAFNYLQEIRLAQAIVESDYKICVDQSHEIKFRELYKHFDLDLEFAKQDNYVEINDEHVHIQHTGESPETRLLNLSKPLILPAHMLDACKEMWKGNRQFDYAFIGLITGRRKKWINQILRRQVNGYNDYTRFLALNLKLYRLLHFTSKGKKNVLITASEKGRKFPGKSWDNDYYMMLANSKFALCPSGDAGCPWTYRFFEAILCGAIPLVETVSPAYNYFKYYTTDTNPEEIVFSREIIQHNFEMAKKHLTVEKAKLNNQLKELLQQ